MKTTEPRERVTITLPKALLERVDRFSAPSRSAAVRALIEKGLAIDAERTEVIEMDLSDDELARLDLWIEVNGGDYHDAFMCMLHHMVWREECARRGL